MWGAGDFGLGTPARETLGWALQESLGWALQGVSGLGTRECLGLGTGVSRSRPGEEKSSGRGEELSFKSNNPTPKVGKNKVTPLTAALDRLRAEMWF